MVDFILYPLAIYGGYVLLGLPKTDTIAALGRKAGQWLIAKFGDK